MVDGKEVSDTERQFLVNWKAIRRARRKNQTQVTDPLTNIETIPTAKQILHKGPPPLTMPALPPRQLPRRIKQHSSPRHGYLTQQLSHNIVATHHERSKQSGSIKLPDIVSTYAAQSVTMDFKRKVVDSLSPIKNPSAQTHVVPVLHK